MTALALTEHQTNPALSYYASLTSAHSKRTMLGTMNSVAKILTKNSDATHLDIAWHEITKLHIDYVISQLESMGKSPKTVNKHINVMRRVALEAYNLDQMTEKQYRLIASVKYVKGSRELKGRDVSFPEMKALTDATKADTNKAKSARDLAILGLLYGAGMRRGEIASLTLASYADGKLTFIGKGNKERSVYVAGKVREYLEAWIAIRSNVEGLLFSTVLKSGEIKATKSVASVAQTVYNVLSERANDAELEGDFARPHDFRRTFIGDQLDAGTDIVTIGAIVGQSDPRTTAKYDRRGERTKQAAATKVNMP